MTTTVPTATLVAIEAELKALRKMRSYLIGLSVAVFFVILAVAFIFAYSRDTDAQVNALSFSNAQTSALAKSNAALLNPLLSKFFAEVQYVCEISGARAAESGLPPPPPNVCDVAFPTKP